jgi:hypothetical protein
MEDDRGFDYKALKLLIDSEKKYAKLLIGEEELINFSDNACYYLLEKMDEIMQFSPRSYKEGGDLQYYKHIYVTEHNEGVKADIPR